MSSFEWTDGLIIEADVFLDYTSPQLRERNIKWIDSHSNFLVLRYSEQVANFCLLVFIGTEVVIDECIEIDTTVWDGTDEEWHTLAIEVYDDEITALHDGKVKFEYQDERLLNLTDSGQVELGTVDAYVCFDNVRVTSATKEPVLCGDANYDTLVDISDAVHLINYVFVPDSPPPYPMESGNTNCDEVIDVSDAVYLINYVFIPGSPVPCQVCR